MIIFARLVMEYLIQAFTLNTDSFAPVVDRSYFGAMKMSLHKHNPIAIKANPAQFLENYFGVKLTKFQRIFVKIFLRTKLLSVFVRLKTRFIVN